MFTKVANETVCRPIPALTEARGYATSSTCRVFLRLYATFILIHMTYITDSRHLEGQAATRLCNRVVVGHHYDYYAPA